ncbi:MAG: GNAT family N-acetyltransferase [candidate division KSB1 bacterium]|nr:GNAT family N-acetyltransferase [candidate division KSB1 bacterium]
MRIIDLTKDRELDYLTCLEEWSDEIKDGVCRKECWMRSMLENGLRVKLARNNAGVVAGMIHYAPIEHTWVEGENLYFVYCIWVHGHKQGRGDMRGHGAGSMLLQAAEDDAKSLRAKGLVVWGMLLPFFMRAKWFKKHGYQKADRNGISVLLWKPFAEDARPPNWIKVKKKPEPVPGKVVVTALANGWCSGINGMIERAKQVCGEFGDRVIYQEIDTSQRSVIREWGLSDALFVDDKNIYQGPPLSYDKIRKIIKKKLFQRGY